MSSWRIAAAAVVAASSAVRALAANVTVGDGGAGSCTEASLDAELAKLVGPGPHFIDLRCGAAGAEAVIPFTTTKVLGRHVKWHVRAPVDGARVVFDGRRSVRQFLLRDVRRLDLRRAGSAELHLFNVVLRNGRVNAADNGGQLAAVRGGAPEGAGGCILAWRTAAVWLERTRFEGCRATGGGGGGAVYSMAGLVTAVDSTFEGNEAEGEGGAVAVRDECCGCAAAFRNCRFWRNRAGSGDGHGGGGALKLACQMHSHRGPAGANSGVYAVADSEFAYNTASGLGSSGGAVAVSGKHSASLTVERTLFYRNRALGRGETGGGAVHYQNAGSPGGVFRDVYFVENFAEGNGGAVRNNRGALDFADCVFSGNYASSWGQANAHSWEHGGVGGALVWDHSYDFEHNGGPLRFTDCVIENSTSDQSGALTVACAPQRYFTRLSFCQNKGTANSGMYRGTSFVGQAPCVPDPAQGRRCEYPRAPVCVLDTLTFGGDTWEGWPDNKRKTTGSTSPPTPPCTVTNTRWPDQNWAAACSLRCDGSNARCLPLFDDPSRGVTRPPPRTEAPAQAPTPAPAHAQRFTPVDGGSGRVCRGADASDNSPRHYRVSRAPSFELCLAQCEGEPACRGVEYSEAGRCEVWTRNIQATAPLDGYACFARAGSDGEGELDATTDTPPGTFTDAAGGAAGGHACRGAHEGDNAAEYFDVVNGVPSLDACKERCRKYSRCNGVEYSGQRCELWVRPGGIRATKSLKGFTCLTYQRPLALVVPVQRHVQRHSFLAPALFQARSAVRKVEL